MTPVVIALIVVAIIASIIFIYSFAHMGSMCSAAEDAAYREYMRQKQEREDG